MAKNVEIQFAVEVREAIAVNSPNWENMPEAKLAEISFLELEDWDQRQLAREFAAMNG